MAVRVRRSHFCSRMCTSVFCWRVASSTSYFHRFWVAAWGLAGLLTLASCDPHPNRQTEAAAVHKMANPAPPPGSTTPPPAPASPSATEPEDQPPPLKLVDGDTIRYRRYVGTLGTRRVVMELYAGYEESRELSKPGYWGRYYDARYGTSKQFDNVGFSPRKRLRLTANNYADDNTDSTEHWELRQPLGPWLTGTVTAADKPRRRVALREDYTDAVPLAIRTAAMYGDSTRFPDFNNQSDTSRFQYFTPHISQKYVQLLGSAAHRRALQRFVQASRPAQLQAHLREEFAGDEQINEYFTMYLNESGILSYSKYVSDYAVGGNHPGAAFPFYTLDLHTGRPITLASLLKPGRTKALHHLILPHLQAADEEALQHVRHHINAMTISDLEDSFGLCSKGLLLKAMLGSYAEGPSTIIIPYAALRPLLRSHTPLNRVLVARGLPPVL
jgi:hypothetical protein